MCMASLQARKWMVLLKNCRIFLFTFYKTKLATAKHEKGAGAGTSKQPLIFGNHNLLLQADSTS